MSKMLSRYDIQVKTKNEQMNLDFIINSDDKKVIHGTVWDDNFTDPQRVPEALVQVYKAGKTYNENPLDIIPIGYVITDASGEFLVGPFLQDSIIIFKVFKFWEDNKNSSNYYYDISLQASGEAPEFTTEDEDV